MYKIVLASGSPRRKEIFEQVGISFSICNSQKEEIITKDLPSDIVRELAEMKAKDVAEGIEGQAIIIGADTMVAINEHILGKPQDEKSAKEMIGLLQGNKHQVYTGVSVIIKEQSDRSAYKIINFYDVTDVWVNPMTEEQIAAYTATKEPYDKAGAYGIQGKFAVHIGRIEGDYLNIVGFPISKLYEVLLREGINIFKSTIA